MNDSFYQFSNWYRQSPGSWLLQLECEETERLLKKFNGDYLLQIGGTTDFARAATYRFHRCCQLNTQFASTPRTGIIANVDELPLLYNSIDAIMLIHTLEFSDHPAQLLQEVYQTLAPGGRLLIIGFNPWSLFGMSKWILRDQGVPWNGKFWSRTQVKSWLINQSYTILFNKTFCFRLPRQKAPIPSLHLFREALGQLCLPTLGSVYLIAAQKRVYHSTNLQTHRWPKQSLIHRPIRVSSE